MKRLIFLSLLGAVAFAPLAAYAQRGGMGGHMGGGMGGGRGGGFSRGGAAPARVSGGFAPRPMGAAGVGMRGAPIGMRGAPIGVRGGAVGARGGVVGVRPVAPGHVFFTTHRFPNHFHNGHFFNNCFGFNCNPFFFNNGFGNPFFFGNGFGFGTGFGLGWGWGWPGYYGYGGYPYYPSDYYPQTQAPAPAATDNGANVQLAVEMQRLSDEVEDLRNENRQAAARPPGGSWSTQQPNATTTFVFRDGRHVATQNYAIAGQTLWIFSERVAHKYSLADLDRAATEEVNAANGIELRLP